MPDEMPRITEGQICMLRTALDDLCGTLTPEAERVAIDEVLDLAGPALSTIDWLRAALAEAEATIGRVRAVHEAAQTRAAAAIPPGMTLTGCYPMEGVIGLYELGAALAGGGQ